MSEPSEPASPPPRLPWRQRLLVWLAFFLGGAVAILIGLPVDATPLIEQGGASQDALERRAYLARRLTEGKILPQDIGTQHALFKGEYAFGTYAMSAYALTHIALDAPHTRPETITLLDGILTALQSAEIRAFDRTQWREDALTSLGGEQGHIAYLGHLNLVLGAYRVVGGDGRHDVLHRRVTAAIARRLRAVPHRHAETYPGETYTMDNVVAVASLEVADHVLGTDHRPLVQSYLAYTRQRLLDPATGLIVFGVNRRTGAPLQRGRGSAGGWASLFLAMIDRDFAREQFDALRLHLAGRLGPFHGVREYHPQDPSAGYGDIDSGPVLVWGVSATGFSLAGARLHRHDAMYAGLLTLAETFGISVSSGGERRYVSAPLLGEAILLAMKTARPWYDGMGARYRAGPR